MNKEQLKKLGWNKIKVKESKKKLHEAKITTKNLQEKTFEMVKFNFGLLYGLIFGLVGNLFILIFDKVYMKNITINTLKHILFVLGGVIIYFIYWIIKETKEQNKWFKTTQMDLENIKFHEKELLLIEKALNKTDKYIKK